jgi:arylsulfatase
VPRADARRVSGSRRGRRTWCAAALGLAAVCCAPAAQPPRLPSVLILTLDTTRADHLGAFGYFRDTSPEIDALAGESIVFDAALAPMATTLPTHVSVFTGTDPLEHGVLANTTQGGQRFVPAPQLRPAAAIAGEVGYATAAFVSAAPLKRGSGVEAGYSTFDEPEEKHRPATGTIDAAIAWLEANGDAPFFLWVHLYDAHWPYAAPPPYDRLFATDAALEAWIAERRIPERAFRPLVGTTDEARPTINAYDGAIRYQDAEVGRLLRWVRDAGRWDSTAILLLGDHGEGLGQHDEIAHGGSWNEQLHAPLLMKIPGQPPRRIAAPVSLVDAMPTFLARLAVPGLALPEGQPSGRDALADAAAAAILSQDTGRERAGPHRFALRAGPWKYFRIEDREGGIRDALYHLESDPFELQDVAARHPERTAALRRAVEAQTRALAARGEVLRAGRPAETRPLAPELQQQLEALGYAAGSAPPAQAGVAPVPEVERSSASPTATRSSPNPTAGGASR